MLRRFESYGFHETTTPEQVAELERVLLHAGDFIPEVLYSAVGRNESDTDVELVWEHAYEGPDAYRALHVPPVPHLHPRPIPAAGVSRVHHRVPSRRGRGTARIRDRRRAVPPRRRDPPARGDEGCRGHRRRDVAGVRVRARRSAVARARHARLDRGAEHHGPRVVSRWVDAPLGAGLRRRTGDAAPLADESGVLDAGPIVGWVDLHYRLGPERAGGAS